MNRRIQTIFCTALCCAFTALAHVSLVIPAGAADLDVRTKAVPFGDLDLSSAAGVKVLYRRIQAAAEEVCKPAMSGDLGQITAARACRERAVDAAVRHVNVVALTRLRFGSEPRLASQ
jgi:UrcA family protein